MPSNRLTTAGHSPGVWSRDKAESSFSTGRYVQIDQSKTAPGGGNGGVYSMVTGGVLQICDTVTGVEPADSGNERQRQQLFADKK